MLVVQTSHAGRKPKESRDGQLSKGSKSRGAAQLLLTLCFGAASSPCLICRSSMPGPVQDKLSVDWLFQGRTVRRLISTRFSSYRPFPPHAQSFASTINTTQHDGGFCFFHSCLTAGKKVLHQYEYYQTLLTLVMRRAGKRMAPGV